MFKKLMTAAVLCASLMVANTASANKIYSENFGRWELMAWDGNNRFCALKTYFRGSEEQTLSLRYTRSEGLTMVVYDSEWFPEDEYRDVNIFIDNVLFGTFTGTTEFGSPNQVFIEIGNDNRFFEKFKAGHRLDIDTPDSHEIEWYNFGLSGTRYLGEKLVNCAREFGM